ncbi:MAG TPA: hypothetical protein VNU97_17125 [Rhizomicrobium sp.]|jgi:hypothetical protein|nr:hypothetical protein [Rhizomicrobium sp.]
MADGRNKYQARESRAQVRKLFMDEWDPIGVRGCEGAEDEYDTYVNRAYVMLMDEGADSDAINDYLWKIATEYMGLSARTELATKCRAVANALVAMRPGFETH